MDGGTKLRKVKAERKENVESAIDKRRDQEIKLLCVYVIWNVCYVYMMSYVCVHDEVCVCIMWCFACHNLYISQHCF